MNQGIRRLALVCGAFVSALIAGCAQQPTRPGEPLASRRDEGGCNPVAAGVIGAVLGAMAGKGKGHAVGAAAGAGIGAAACVAYNYHVRQLRSAPSVEQEHRTRFGDLPAQNTVDSYRSELNPSSTVLAGRPSTMRSNIVVLQGQQDRSPRLAEEIVIYGPDGRVLKRARKDASQVAGTGEYQTDFDINLPKGVVGGRWKVRSTLYMDERAVGTNDVDMLVVG